MSSAALPSTTRPKVHEDASCCTGASASSTGAVTIQGVEVHRCCRAQCLPSLSKSLTSARWSKERCLAKNVSSATDASTVKAHNRARRTHLPRIPIQPDLPARLSCSRPKLASARPKLASTYRMRLRRAACAAAAGLLQARIVHHDCAAAPHRLLSPAPLSLKTVRCAAVAGRGPCGSLSLQIQPQGDVCTGTLLSIVAAHEERMPSRASTSTFRYPLPPFLSIFFLSVHRFGGVHSLTFLDWKFKSTLKNRSF